MARARVWDAAGTSGVPVGEQTEAPPRMARGWPSDVTLTEPVSQRAETHGPLPMGGAKSHPATLYDSAMVAMGWPETVTRGLGATGWANPPCRHRTVAPTCKIELGILYHRQCARVDVDNRAHQRDGGALPVADVNARIVDDDDGPGSGLEHDSASGGRGRSIAN